ncbi:MAG TPA: TIR domain-containing protein [Isosphaeraceae bacterium]|nr:TIR domain-containing protein [Isosphaeraceae bacterium]
MASSSRPDGGRVVTFYSYKGGAGRSLALANVAWILASSGLRVLVIDWDLEAPGLHRYLAPFLIDKEMKETDGVIDLVWDFAAKAMTPPDSGEGDDGRWYEQLADFRNYAVALRYEFPGKGTIAIVPAGRQDANYSQRVGNFDWRQFYEEMGGGVFLEAAREQARRYYDYVLIDSRTGVSDASGMCTIHLPDDLVVFFTANNQSIRGTSGVAADVRAQWAKDPDRANQSGRIFPVLTRVDPFERDKLELRRRLAAAEFASLLRGFEDLEGRRGISEMPYIPFYSYEETLAAFADRPGDTEAVLLPSLERLTALITDGRVDRLKVSPDETLRRQILAEFEGRKAADMEIARRAVASERYDVFVSYSEYDKSVVEEVVRWLQREGLRPWFAPWVLIPGVAAQRAVAEAIALCQSMVVFVGPKGLGPWQTEELQRALQRTVGAGASDKAPGRPPFRVIPVLLPGVDQKARDTLPPVLIATSWVEFRDSIDDPKALRVLLAGIRGEAPLTRAGESPPPGTSPFVGLRPFDVGDSAWFFGREALVEELVQRLREGVEGGECRFLAVLGASGSGKTSLVHAGLLGALKAGRLEGSASWPVAIVRPGADPFQSLAQALAGLYPSSSPEPANRRLVADLKSGERGLGDLAWLIVASRPKGTHLLVLVNQFEEVFNLAVDATERQDFISSLLQAANTPDGPVCVVVTMRADFYGECLAHRDLAQAVSAHQVVVGPMTPAELRLAIERPALVAGLTLEPGLVELLIGDVQGEPGALPLLQFALHALWEQREDNRLTIAAYREIGGLQLALQRRADAVFAGLAPAEQEACRRIFLRLYQGGGAIGSRRRPARELLPANPDTASAVQRVLDQLAAARLIVIEQDAQDPESRTVEVAHSRLIRDWPRLRQWVDLDRSGLEVRRRLTEAARQWQSADRSQDLLFTGTTLAQAEEWATRNADYFTIDEIEFLNASRRVEDLRRVRQRWIRRLLVSQAVIAAVLLVMAAMFYWACRTSYQKLKTTEDSLTKEIQARQESEYRVREAELVTGSIRLAAASQAQRNRRLDRALLLAVEAVKTHNTFDARRSLFQALTAWPGLLGFLHASGGRAQGVAFSPDGKILAAAVRGVDSGVVLWDVPTRRRLGPPLPVPEGVIGRIAFSPDGAILAAGFEEVATKAPSSRGGIVRWDVFSRKRLGEAPQRTAGGIRRLAFSPDGVAVASAADDGTVTVWDARTGKPFFPPLAGRDAGVSDLAFSPDAKALAATSGASIRVWDAMTGKLLFSPNVAHKADVTAVAFSPDSQTLASASDDKTVIFWSSDTFKPRGEPIRLNSEVTDLVFSPDGRTLIASAAGGVTVWDVATRRPIGPGFKLPEGVFQGIAVSSDGRTLASALSYDPSRGCVALWDLSYRSQLGAVLPVVEGITNDLAFSSDSQTLAAAVAGAGSAGSVILWDVTSLQRKGPPLVTKGGEARAVAFSSRGPTLAAGYSSSPAEAGGVAFWDASTWKPFNESKVTAASTEDVVSLAFNPNGQTLAVLSCARDAGPSGSRVSLWSIEKGIFRPTSLTLSRDGMTTLAFSPDGVTLAAGLQAEDDRSGSGSVVLWHWMSSERQESYQRVHEKKVTSLAFHPRDDVLAIGCVAPDGTSSVVELRHVTGREGSRTPMIDVPEGNITSLTFSPDGAYLAVGIDAVGSLQSGVLLWDVEARCRFTEQPIPSPGGGVGRVGFTPDAKTLAATFQGFKGSAGSGVAIWGVDPTSWVQKAARMANRNLSMSEWQEYFGDQEYRRTFSELPGDDGASQTQPRIKN